MRDQAKRKVIGTILKFLLSGLALYVVFNGIDGRQMWAYLSTAHWGWLSLALLAFVASKVVSAQRLLLYFYHLDLALPVWLNLRLYWIGMFYNLFLPGGIGGDGYKVYLLHRKFGHPIKGLISASLVDRLNGMVALLVLALLGMYGLALQGILRIPIEIPSISWLLVALLGFPTFYLTLHLFFRTHKPDFLKTSAFSLAVQGLQIICSYFILRAIGVDEQILAYQTLFLFSSVVAVLPFTIGGVGARELTFILGHSYLGIDQEIAVAFSLLFFLITAVVSAVGGFLRSDLAKSDSVSA